MLPALLARYQSPGAAATGAAAAWATPAQLNASRAAAAAAVRITSDELGLQYRDYSRDAPEWRPKAADVGLNGWAAWLVGEGAKLKGRSGDAAAAEVGVLSPITADSCRSHLAICCLLLQLPHTLLVLLHAHIAYFWQRRQFLTHFPRSRVCHLTQALAILAPLQAAAKTWRAALAKQVSLGAVLLGTCLHTTHNYLARFHMPPSCWLAACLHFLDSNLKRSQPLKQVTKNAVYAGSLGPPYDPYGTQPKAGSPRPPASRYSDYDDLSWARLALGAGWAPDFKAPSGSGTGARLLCARGGGARAAGRPLCLA